MTNDRDLNDELGKAEPNSIQWMACCFICREHIMGLMSREEACDWKRAHITAMEGHVVSIGVEFKAESGAKMGFVVSCD